MGRPRERAKRGAPADIPAEQESTRTHPPEAFTPARDLKRAPQVEAPGRANRSFFPESLGCVSLRSLLRTTVPWDPRTQASVVIRARRKARASTGQRPPNPAPGLQEQAPSAEAAGARALRTPASLRARGWLQQASKRVPDPSLRLRLLLESTKSKSFSYTKFSCPCICCLHAGP